jgi:sugar phosphate permease
MNTNTMPQQPCCKFQPWLVVLSAALFFFYIFIQMNIFNAISPALLKEFNLSAVQLSGLATYYFYGNIIFLFPAGLLLDRVSVRKLLLLALFVSAGCTYLFSVSHSLTAMNLARLGLGLAGSFALVPCIKLASRWFPPNRMALVIGLVVTMAMLGGMVAQTPVTLLTDHYGWRMALSVGAGLGAVLLVLIALFVRDFPPGMEKSGAAAPGVADDMSIWRSIGMALKNSQTWLAGCYTSLVNLPIFILSTWGALYLGQVHNLSREHASYIISMMFIGAIIGGPLAGAISDRLRLRRAPMIVGAIIAIILMALLLFVPHLSFTALLVLVLLLGVITSAQVIGYPVVAESNPPAITATATSISSILIMSGGLLNQVFGWLVERNWDHKMVDGVPFYSNHDYCTAMSIMLIGFVLALIASLLVKETHCKNITSK